MKQASQTRKPKGFATLSPERRREIARLGGQASHRLGKAHQWTSKEAQDAGRKGGMISRRLAAKKKGNGASRNDRY